MTRERLFTRAFVLCWLANLAQGLAFNLFLHFPGFLNEIGADDLQIGLLFGLTSIAAIAVRPPVGRVMDERGRRVVVLVGGAMNVAVCAGYLGIHSLGPAIYALRVAHGLAEALLFTSLFTLAADLVPASRRTEGLAFFGISGLAPMAVAGLLGDIILQRTGYEAIFATALAFAVASLLLSIPLHDAPRSSHGEPERSQGFAAALRQRDLLPMWWVGSAFAIALACVFAFLKRYVDETGFSSVGGFFAAYCGAAIVLRAGFGWLPDRVGPKRVLFPALACLGAGLAALAMANSDRDVILAGLLCGVGHGITFPILFAMVVTRARDADRGSTLAIFTALFDLGMLVGGPLFGAVSRVAGFHAAYGAAAAVLMVGTLVFSVWDRRR